MACSLPTAEDPMDLSFRTTFRSPSPEEGDGDDKVAAIVDPAAVLLCGTVLEVRRTVSRKVFFRCTCCAHLPRSERAKMSAIAPRRMRDFHRAFSRFVAHHVPSCPQIPQEIKKLSIKDAQDAKAVRAMAKFWEDSAIGNGLSDGRGGAIYHHGSP